MESFLLEEIHFWQNLIWSAYRRVPVHSDDRYLLGMKWRAKYLIDLALPFGLHSAPYIFSSLAGLLE